MEVHRTMRTIVFHEMHELLNDLGIVAAICQAWEESLPNDPNQRHEEGGYIVVNPDRSRGIERWPRGERSRIAPPPLDGSGCYNGKGVLAAFHTHPNPPVDERGREWEQGPSSSDVRWHVRRKIHGFVICCAFVYEIEMMGNVVVVGNFDEVMRT